MNKNFATSLREVLKHEGGYVNHPKDPGGHTNKGITLATYRRYIDPHGTPADLRNLTNDQAAVVYRRHYWDAVRGSELPSGVDFAVFDFAVNSGPSRAVRFLQRVLGVQADGRLGPETFNALKKRHAVEVINRLMEARLAFLKRLKTWPTFGKGWRNRVSTVRAVALTMAQGYTTPWQPPSGDGEGGLIGLILRLLRALFSGSGRKTRSPSGRPRDREDW